MAAVRVPPSACRTSQSSTMVFSPRALVSMMERSERPMRREISWVRPPILPLTDSRSERVLVARGSMAYSAVTQPRPSPLSQRGTPSVREAVHRTRVLPNSIRAEPSACLDQPRVMLIGRSWSGVRPSARMTGVAIASEVMRLAYRAPAPPPPARPCSGLRRRQRPRRRRTPASPRPDLGLRRPHRNVREEQSLAPASAAASPARLPVRCTSLMSSSRPSSNAASQRKRSESFAASSSPWHRNRCPPNTSAPG